MANLLQLLGLMYRHAVRLCGSPLCALGCCLGVQLGLVPDTLPPLPSVGSRTLPYPINDIVYFLSSFAGVLCKLGVHPLFGSQHALNLQSLPPMHADFLSASHVCSSPLLMSLLAISCCPISLATTPGRMHALPLWLFRPRRGSFSRYDL